MTPENAAALRKPFDPKHIGKLPKGGALLDFVGHAVATDRLLSVDPAWTWEPFALDPAGLPALDKEGNLWIRLTVCGVTTVGVGDGKSMKERISDAIRNAAMRRGVALDLWSKEELESQAAPPPPPVVTDAEWLQTWRAEVLVTDDIGRQRGLWNDAKAKHAARGLTDGDWQDCQGLINERVAELQKTASVVAPLADRAAAVADAMKKVEAGWPKTAKPGDAA